MKRRILSGLTALTLVFGSIPCAAFADEPIVDGNPPIAQVQDQDVQEQSLSVQDVSEVAYVYIDNPHIITDQTQAIVVGFTDERTYAQSAELTLEAEDGTRLAYQTDGVTDGAVLFSIPGAELSEGAYRIVSIAYQTGDQAAGSEIGHVIDFTQDETDYSFQVTAGSGEVVSGESSDAAQANGESQSGEEAATTAYTLDGAGELVKTADVASALSTATGSASTTSTTSNSSGLLSTQSLLTQSFPFIIVLDAGHGGYDGGATGIGFLEKDVNLKIAQYVKEELEQYFGVLVVMTRDSDVFVSLSDRVNIAVAAHANLVLSLHNNAGSGSGVGSEVIVPREGAWYYQETYVTGNELGRRVLSNLVALGMANRGVYSKDSTNGSTYDDGTLSDYFTLIAGPRESGILGIIIEHAFVDAEPDASRLRSDEQLHAFAHADVQAVVDQFGLTKDPQATYWPIYNSDFYRETHPDLKAAYGNDSTALASHFVQYGVNEGRQGSVVFDPVYYRSTYPDLAAVYGDEYVQYYQHFLDYGMNEGRQGSAQFSPSYYRATYPDLEAAYGDDWTSYYEHYVLYGMNEGREGVADGSQDPDNPGTPSEPSDPSSPDQPGQPSDPSQPDPSDPDLPAVEVMNPITAMAGVDFSAVYDPVYYAQMNPDVALAATRGSVVVGDTLLDHFVNYGMREGRTSSRAFSLGSYYNAYPDLRQVYGSDWESYYRHFALYGSKEGRAAQGVSELQGAVTVFDNVDYAPVYDGLYYARNNEDVAAFATRTWSLGAVLDDTALLEHFVAYGMNEQREASAEFDVKSYYNAYPDLRAAYRTDWKSYYLHYVLYGKAEGRVATGTDQLVVDPNERARIMGASLTSVDQMVRRYTSVGYTYPSAYATLGAPTIRDFCQIMYEEAAMENVRAEVAFAQSMHETGWLQFGGDVEVEQCNFGGLGATGGVGGATFPDVRTGVRALIQHLKAYASTEPLVNPVVDPRFSLVTRGIAPTVYDLSGRWAVSTTYGDRVMAQVDALLSA